MIKKYRNLLKYIAETDASCANDIVYSLELVRTSLDTTLHRVKKEIKLATENNSFDNIAQIADYCKQIKELDDILLSLFPYLHTKEIDTPKPIVHPVTEKQIVSVANTTKTSSIKVNYSDYDVDRYEAHSLDEDFGNKKVCAIKINGEKIMVSNWQDAVVSTCAHLYKINPALMKSFVDNPIFIGRKVSNFGYVKVGNRNKRIPGTDLYVWTNHSANVHVDNIKKILSEYDITLDEVVIYLKRDLSELHK